MYLFFCFQNFSSVRDRQQREHYKQMNCKNLTIINKNIHRKLNKRWYHRLESKKSFRISKTQVKQECVCICLQFLP